MKTEEMRGLLALMVRYSSSKEPTQRERMIASAATFAVKLSDLRKVEA